MYSYIGENKLPKWFQLKRTITQAIAQPPKSTTKTPPTWAIDKAVAPLGGGAEVLRKKTTMIFMFLGKKKKIHTQKLA